MPHETPLGNLISHTYIPDGFAAWPRPFFHPRDFSPSAPLRVAVPARTRLVSKMRHRRRRVYIDTHKGRVSAGFTVAAQADAADVSMRLRERGWIAYRLRLDTEQHAWVATVIDWTRRAA